MQYNIFAFVHLRAHSLERKMQQTAIQSLTITSFTCLKQSTNSSFITRLRLSMSLRRLRL